MNQQEIDALVEKLRCGLCNNYLSWPPIVLLADGNSACGHCTPPLPRENPDGSVVRELALEQVLRKLTFPCKYKPEGCQDRIFFGYLNHEECDCIYRPTLCPTEMCPWVGPMPNVPQHFAEAHSAMMKNELKFNLQLDEDVAQEFILATIKKVPFLVKYIYTADQDELLLEISCLTLDKASYKIWMFNEDMSDCGVSIKGEKCLRYNFKHCHAFITYLDKYLPVLKNPTCITVIIDMVIEKDDEKDSAAPANVASVPAIGNVKILKNTCFPVMPLLKVRRIN